MKTWHWIVGGIAVAGAGYHGWRYLYGKTNPTSSSDPIPMYEIGQTFAPECGCSITERSLKAGTWYYGYRCDKQPGLKFWASSNYETEADMATKMGGIVEYCSSNSETIDNPLWGVPYGIRVI